MLGLGVPGWALRPARWGGVTVLAVLGLIGCSNPNELSLSTQIGTAEDPLRVVIDADALGLPEELRDDGGDEPTIMVIPCDAEGPACPSSDEVSVTCDGEGCNPDPIAISVPMGDVFDLSSLRSQLDLANVQSFEITSVDYAVAFNTMTVDVPELTVLWASEGASAGETRIGTVPPIPAGERPSGEMQIDDAGNAALSDFLLTANPPRVRFFVEGHLDPQPGDPWPEGSLEVTAIIRVRVQGRLL
jgi:hypothetical protein